MSRIIYDAIQSLRIMPYRGRPGRIDNTRELLVQRLPYVIVYEGFDERVLILNIVHAAQKWPN
jgi:toxin ParE1/3/4